MVQAKLFIDFNYAESIDISNIADEACFSKFHFIRLFKKIYGRTPHQYESAEAMAKLVKAGTFGFGVFSCNDVFATYEELKSKGVEFTKPPKEEFYGTEAMFKDDSGNWFSLVSNRKW